MKLKENVVLYLRYAAVCTQGIMQYKLSFVLMVFARFMISFCELIAIKFIIFGSYTDQRLHLWRGFAVFFDRSNVLYLCGAVWQRVQGVFWNGAQGSV